MRAILAAALLAGCAAAKPAAPQPPPDWLGETTGLFMDGATQSYRAVARGKNERAAVAAAFDELRVLADCHVERLEEEYRLLTEGGDMSKARMSEPDVCGVSYPDVVGPLHVKPGFGPLAKKVGKLASEPEAWSDPKGGAVARVEVTRAALDGALIDDENLSPKLRVFVHAQAVKAWREEKDFLEKGLSR